MSAGKRVFLLPSFRPVNQFEWKYSSLSTSYDSSPWRAKYRSPFFFFYSWIHLWEVCVCVGVLSFVTPMLLSDTWMKVLFRLCAAATTISETRARSLTGFPPNEHHQLFFFLKEHKHDRKSRRGTVGCFDFCKTWYLHDYVAEDNPF